MPTSVSSTTAFRIRLPSSTQTPPSAITEPFRVPAWICPTVPPPLVPIDFNAPLPHRTRLAKRKVVPEPSSQPRRSRKTSKHWARDWGQYGRTALDILYEWIMDDRFQARWGGKGGASKPDMIKEFNMKLRDEGIPDERSRSSIEDKVRDIEREYKDAQSWRNNTGAGLTGDPEEVERDIREAILKRCPRFFKLEPFLAKAARIQPGGLHETQSAHDPALEFMRLGGDFEPADETEDELDDEDIGSSASHDESSGNQLGDAFRSQELSADQFELENDAIVPNTPIEERAASHDPQPSPATSTARRTSVSVTPTSTPSSQRPMSLTRPKGSRPRAMTVTEIMQANAAEKLAFERQRFEVETQLGRDRLDLEKRRLEQDDNRAGIQAKAEWLRTMRDLAMKGWSREEIVETLGPSP